MLVANTSFLSMSILVLFPPHPPGALVVHAALWALVHCSSTTALSALDTMRQVVGAGALVVVVGLGVVFSLSSTSAVESPSFKAAVSGWSVMCVSDNQVNTLKYPSIVSCIALS